MHEVSGASGNMRCGSVARPWLGARRVVSVHAAFVAAAGPHRLMDNGVDHHHEPPLRPILWTDVRIGRLRMTPSCRCPGQAALDAPRCGLELKALPCTVLHDIRGRRSHLQT